MVLIRIWIRIRVHKRNRNFSKVGTGTAINHYGSSTLLLIAIFLSFAASLIACHLSQFYHAPVREMEPPLATDQNSQLCFHDPRLHLLGIGLESLDHCDDTIKKPPFCVEHTIFLVIVRYRQVTFGTKQVFPSLIIIMASFIFLFFSGEINYYTGTYLLILSHSVVFFA